MKLVLLNVRWWYVCAVCIHENWTINTANWGIIRDISNEFLLFFSFVFTIESAGNTWETLFFLSNGMYKARAGRSQMIKKRSFWRFSRSFILPNKIIKAFHRPFCNFTLSTKCCHHFSSKNQVGWKLWTLTSLINSLGWHNISFTEIGKRRKKFAIFSVFCSLLGLFVNFFSPFWYLFTLFRSLYLWALVYFHLFKEKSHSCFKKNDQHKFHWCIKFTKEGQKYHELQMFPPVDQKRRL